MTRLIFFFETRVDLVFVKQQPSLLLLLLPPPLEAQPVNYLFSCSPLDDLNKHNPNAYLSILAFSLLDGG